MPKINAYPAKYYRTIMGSVLAGTSLLNLALPVLAAGTTAGETISNTATAEYDNPGDPNTPFTTKSNTVIITVAKVAGITNVPAGFKNLGDPGNSNSGAGGTVLTNHKVEFLFNVTNTGNDATNIFIPAIAGLVTTGLTTSSIEFSTNGGTTFQARPANGIVENVAANTTIQVRVTGTVTATSAGAPVSVRLGDTGSNTAPNSPAADTQNQPDLPDTALSNEVRTETATTPTVAGAPANGQREASATNSVFLGSNPKAMAIIRKTNTGVTDANTTLTPTFTDDQITYNLSLEVASSSPTPRFTPGSLAGRNYSGAGTNPEAGTITLTGGGSVDNSNLILVSDAIPTNTTLKQAPTAPNGWTVVYTTSNSATTLPNAAAWTSTAPTSPTEFAAVTRIGWVYNANSPNSAIAPGTTVSPFTFIVTTTGLNATSGGTVANIAQVFGTTAANGINVFDESGDSSPANLNVDGSDGPGEGDPLSTGVADPASQGVDANNNNTGSGPGGEDNVLSINAPGTILNGPVGQPAASGDIFQPGTNDNNHDFQNVAIAPDAIDATSDPAAVTFTNTLSNPDPTKALTNILLQPIQPSAISSTSSINSRIPNGTIVTVNFQGSSATYTYNNGVFTIAAGTPIFIPSLSPGVTVNYTVVVDLPAAVGNSTDVVSNALIGGFPIPIVAYKDSDGNGTPFLTNGTTPETIANYTVNQLYKGYLKLIKQVRILDASNNVITGMDYLNPNTDKKPQPGDKLEYRVVYRNISEPQGGSGTNVILNANNVVITENGALLPNNWARDNAPTDGNIDTLNVQGSATDTSTGSSINYLINGNATSNGTIDTGTNVTGYKVNIPQLAPAGIPTTLNPDPATPSPGDRTFVFRRLINNAAPTTP